MKSLTLKTQQNNKTLQCYGKRTKTTLQKSTRQICSKIGSVGYWIDDQTELSLLAYSRPHFKRTGNETNTKKYMLVVYRNGKEINSLKDELISFSNKAIEQSLKESIKQMYSQHID